MGGNSENSPGVPRQAPRRIESRIEPRLQDTESRRKELVEALVRHRHIRTGPVERAFRLVPRHSFMPAVSPREAYADRAVPLLDSGGNSVSSLSAPAWIARMLEELDLAPGMRVLEVGAGTGYNAALIAYVVGREGAVFTVEIEPWLAVRARSNLTRLGFDNVTVIEADGAHGAARAAPFDRILLTTGTWEVFPAWTQQLAAGGRLLAPVQFGAAEGACLVLSLEFDGDHLQGRAVMGSEMVPMRGVSGGARAAEQSRAGHAWRPAGVDELASVRVYDRFVRVEPAANEKLFVRGECQILLERVV